MVVGTLVLRATVWPGGVLEDPPGVGIAVEVPASAPALVPTPAAAPEPVVPASPDEAARALLEEFALDVEAKPIVRSEGLQVWGIFEPGYDFLADEGDWMEWTRHFAARPVRPVDDEPFEERARLVLDPTPCHVFHRQVTDPEVGIGGEAGARVTQTLLASLGPFPYAHLEDPGRCDEVVAGDWPMPGYVLDELQRVPCGHPDGKELRCFVASRWYYDLEARNHWTAQFFILDRATGLPVEGEALHPGLTRAEVGRLFGLLVRATAPESPGDFVPPGVVVPEPDGLAMWWTEYSDFLAGLDGVRIVVPWEVVDIAVAHLAG
jgi:hypothetical protein